MRKVMAVMKWKLYGGGIGLVPIMYVMGIKKRKKVLSLFVFFKFKLTLFFREILLFSVLNDRHWSSLLRCLQM